MASSSQKIIVGIDIGSQIVRVIVAEEAAKIGMAPKIVAVGWAESRGIHHGYVISPRDATTSVAEAIAMAEKSSGIEIKRAYVSLGGISLSSEIAGGASSVGRADGEVTEDDMMSVVSIAREAFGAAKKNKKILHAIPMKYRLDGAEVMGNPVGMRGSRLETRVVFVTVQEHHFNDLVSVITDAGVDIIEVIAAPIAESLATLSKKQKMVGCGLLNIGADTVSLAVFDSDVPVSVATFAIGSSDITNDIALGLRVTLEEAERVKIGKFEAGQYPKKKIEEIIDARLSDIFELIQNHLKSIKRDGLLPAGIIITGGGGMLTHIDEFSKSALKLPSLVMHVDQIMNTRKGLDPSWLVAYGLCYLEDDEEVYGSKIFKQMFKESKKGIMKILREFLP
ncbi:MAG: Cell division protein FtsA [Patescibacteria group bacterium]|nr:Cell division protein FtsA [Patescibacteria group bacterium]